PSTTHPLRTFQTLFRSDAVTGGTILAETPETRSIVHKSMVPPNLSGTIKEAVPDGDYTILDTIAVLELPDGTTKDLTLCQKWPIDRKSTRLNSSHVSLS